MDERMSKELAVYFSRREDVPSAVKAGLRRRLRQAENTAPAESFAWLWVLAPFAALFSVAVIFLAWVFLGHGALLLAAAGYMLSVPGAAVILLALKPQNIKEG